MRCPPTMENPGSELAPSMDQDRPALVGRASSTVTPRAVPAPPLCTAMTYPMGSAALTGVAAAALVMAMELPRMVTEAEASAEPSLEVDTWAEVSTGESATVAEVVGEAMCTE